MRHALSALLMALWLGAGAPAAAQNTTVGFETLPEPPATDGAMGLYYANGSSSLYEGVVWDMRLRVVGADYRIAQGSPLYGLPHGGDYFVTNEGDGSTNDGLRITTGRVLLGAWFGRNAYYGFGDGGADQVTIHALAGDQVLGSVVFDLPAAALQGQPAALSFVDTGSFAGLAGITGYRIDRRELGTLQGNWIADDFVFAAPVPEPSAALLLLAGLCAVTAACRRRGARAAA